jgi:translation initiation factor 3 subunit D
VFTTDKVLGALMCANRSTYSWELIVKKEQGRIYLDKREGGSLDFLTVNENAAEPPVESADKECINGPTALAMEATMINQAFVKTTIKSDETLTFPNENYMEDSAFRYREWDLGTTANEEPIRLVVRTHIDAAIHVPNASPSCELNTLVSSTHKKGETLLATIHALNEFDSKAPGAGGAPEWRQKLDSQRGAVMATEMKNNNNKLARWTVESILSGADQMKLGMVSRAHSKDRHHHTVLGMLTLKPEDFAKQLNLSLDNGWGIVKTFVDLFYRKLQDGTYVLMKDPTKPLMRLYAVPDSPPVEEIQEDFEEEESQPILLADE